MGVVWFAFVLFSRSGFVPSMGDIMTFDEYIESKGNFGSASCVSILLGFAEDDDLDPFPNNIDTIHPNHEDDWVVSEDDESASWTVQVHVLGRGGAAG